MSDIQGAFVETMNASTDVLSLATTNIYADALPQRKNGEPDIPPPSLGAIRVLDVSGEPDHTLSGRAPMIQHRLQVDCYSRTRSVAATLREYVCDLFDQYKGLMGSIQVHGCIEAGRRGDYEPPIDGSDQGRYVRSIDFLVCTAEST